MARSDTQPPQHPPFAAVTSSGPAPFTLNRTPAAALASVSSIKAASIPSPPLALPPRLDSCDGAATGLRRRSLDSGEVSEDACGCADKPIPRAKMLVFDKAKIGTPVPVYAE